MRRFHGIVPMLATLFAVLLPLEAAHCAFMGRPAVASESVAVDVDAHACCRLPGAGDADVPESGSADCACLQLPAAPSTTVSMPGAPDRVDGALPVVAAVAEPAVTVLEGVAIERDEGPPRSLPASPAALRGPPTLG
jgi:hypothetical protein